MVHGGSSRPRVLIVGAGAAGLEVARSLARQPVDVLLVDRNNYQLFLPLLWQVASAVLAPEEISSPVRSVLRRQRNARFALLDVTEVDLADRRVRGDGHELAYDYLVLATGSAPQFYGIPGAALHTRPLKSLGEALALRNQIVRCFERAEIEEDEEVRRRHLTFVVVGGGPTGVEFSASVAELARSLLGRDMPRLRGNPVRIVLLEAQGRLLPGFPERLATFSARRLLRMGIDLRLGAEVTEVTAEGVRLRDGTAIDSETVVWTAGVQGDPAAAEWGLQVVRGGRVSLLPSLQLAARPEVYIAGDLAYHEADGQPLPMVWTVAAQQGRAVARNIGRQVQGREPQPFRYRDPGSLAVLGRLVGVARLWDRPVTGPIAWLVWAWVHLWGPVSWRNRLAVAQDWLWDLLGRRTMRLIQP